jgi:hypothetical protein
LTALELPAPEIASLLTPRNYQALRDEHARATQALDQHIEKAGAPENGVDVERQQPGHAAEMSAEHEQGPTRPQQHDRTGGPMTGGREAVEGWGIGYNNRANADYFAWAAANHGARDAQATENDRGNATHDAELEKLDRHCDGQQPENAPDRGEALEALERNEASQERGDKQIESQSQQRESAPQEVAAWDAWEARVERNEAAERGDGQENSNRADAREALDRHIESRLNFNKGT